MKVISRHFQAFMKDRSSHNHIPVFAFGNFSTDFLQFSTTQGISKISVKFFRLKELLHL